MSSNTLRLSLKKKWFDMTKAGIKTEDYRELTPYWAKRLCTEYVYYDDSMVKPLAIFKLFANNTMTLGYPSNSDTSRIITLEHKGIEIRTGNPEWGAEPGKLYFVIKHGAIINHK